MEETSAGDRPTDLEENLIKKPKKAKKGKKKKSRSRQLREEHGFEMEGGSSEDDDQIVKKAKGARTKPKMAQSSTSRSKDRQVKGSSSRYAGEGNNSSSDHQNLADLVGQMEAKDNYGKGSANKQNSNIRAV